ncbi:DHHW family protein [Virgibacillus sp. FSP13]
MKTSLGDKIVVVIFLAFIFSFGIWSLVKPDDKMSVVENRNLDQRPDATSSNLLSGEYFKRFQSYYNDQFPLRSQWIEANNKIEKVALQQDVVNSEYISDDGYLIPTLVSSDDTLTPKDIAHRINKFATNVENEDVNIYFSLVPNKTTMMEYKLPDYVFSEANQLSNQLINNLNNVASLDLRNAIKAHMNEKNLYFYTDHHWKAKAAYYAYQEIVSEIKENNKALSGPIPKDRFIWKESEAKFLGSDARKTTASYVEMPDTVTIARPDFEHENLEVCYRGECDKDLYDFRYLKLQDKYTNRYKVYMSGDFPEGIIRNPNVNNNQRLLILKDSYANPMIQFLSRHFEETRVLDLRHYDKKSVYQYIDENNIDDVLFIHNINSLVTTPSLTNFKK